MAKSFNAGDKVGWDSSGGHSTGKVVRKLTEPMKIQGVRSPHREIIRNILLKAKPASARLISRQDSRGLDLTS